MLGGMRALPDDGWSAASDGAEDAPLPGPWEAAGMVAHVFTHFSLQLSVQVHAGTGVPQGEGEWWPLDRLEEAGLPTLFAKAARLGLSAQVENA
jgi:A/G-specific DNA glycosylase